MAHTLKGNIVNSPLSAHIVLSYLFHGSGGETTERMIAGLYLADTEQLHVQYKKLIAILDVSQR